MVLVSFALHALRRCARWGPGHSVPWAAATNFGCGSRVVTGTGTGGARAGTGGAWDAVAHMSRALMLLFFVCGVLHVSVGADTASAWRRPNVLWALDLHTVYRGDATERRHSACPPNQAPHKVCLMFFSVAVPLALGIQL